MRKKKKKNNSNGFFKRIFQFNYNNNKDQLFFRKKFIYQGGLYLSLKRSLFDDVDVCGVNEAGYTEKYQKEERNERR